MFDLDAYLARIGLRGEPSTAEVHRAHATTIPFENLDPQSGVPVSLALVDLQRKLVLGGRGGYCFEQNLLLGAALEALGAEVDLFLARVRYGVAPGATRPRSHLLLRVREDRASWHADVGFGLGSLRDPLPWGVGGEHDQAGWRYRVIEQHPELVLQIREAGRWVDLYGFLPHPVARVDVETINWWACTHPRSPFVTGLMVSSQDAEGRRTSLASAGGLALAERTPSDSVITPVTPSAVPGLLAECFGLHRVVLGDDGRLFAAPGGSG